jgi:hypothetical protein
LNRAARADHATDISRSGECNAAAARRIAGRRALYALNRLTKSPH